MKWFETQKRIKFYCTSLLIAYDGSKSWLGKRSNNSTNHSGFKQSFSTRNGESNGLWHQLSTDMDEDNLSKEYNELAFDENNAGMRFVADDVVMGMIDFTHTFIDTEGMMDSVDENYIYGLRSLIDIFQNMLS